MANRSSSAFPRTTPPHPHTHNYIYVHTVTHTYKETKNYRTHQLFIFTSPVESNPGIEKPVVRVQGWLPAVREKAQSLPGSERRPWYAQKLPACKATQNVSLKCFLLEPQTPHMPQPHLYPGFPGGSMVKNPPVMQEVRVRSLGWEDSMEKG